MIRSIIGILCGTAAVLLFLLPSGDNGQPPVPPPSPRNQMVSEAFDTYERLWIELSVQAAEKLERGELKTPEETWTFIASGQEPARKVAFDTIAKTEQEKLGGDKWTPELHAEVLKSYSK